MKISMILATHKVLTYEHGQKYLRFGQYICTVIYCPKLYLLVIQININIRKKYIIIRTVLPTNDPIIISLVDVAARPATPRRPRGTYTLVEDGPPRRPILRPAIATPLPLLPQSVTQSRSHVTSLPPVHPAGRRLPPGVGIRNIREACQYGRQVRHQQMPARNTISGIVDGSFALLFSLLS